MEMIDPSLTLVCLYVHSLPCRRFIHIYPSLQRAQNSLFLPCHIFLLNVTGGCFNADWIPIASIQCKCTSFPACLSAYSTATHSRPHECILKHFHCLINLYIVRALRGFLSYRLGSLDHRCRAHARCFNHSMSRWRDAFCLLCRPKVSGFAVRLPQCEQIASFRRVNLQSIRERLARAGIDSRGGWRGYP